MVESLRVCGREWSVADLEQVREEVQRASPPLRAEISRRVCARLEWTDALGRAKLMSCRVALLRLHRRGLIELPPPRNGNGNGKGLLRQRLEWPSAAGVVTGSVSDLGTVELVPVADRETSALWNGLIDRYHYLG